MTQKQHDSKSYFPTLTKCLGPVAERLLKGLPFDEIQNAARIQAKEGDEAARRFLASFQTGRKTA
jgi:hypothetical protein